MDELDAQIVQTVELYLTPSAQEIAKQKGIRIIIITVWKSGSLHTIKEDNMPCINYTNCFYMYLQPPTDTSELQTTALYEMIHFIAVIIIHNKTTSA